MKLCIATILAVGFLAGADVPKQQQFSSDVEALQGNWKLVEGVVDGEELDATELEEGRLTIDGNRFTIKLYGEDTCHGTQTLNQNANPKTIDIVYTDGPYKGDKFLGIYKLEGDDYRVTISPPGEKRPTSFTPDEGTGQWTHLWERTSER